MEDGSRILQPKFVLAMSWLLLLNVFAGPAVAQDTDDLDRSLYWPEVTVTAHLDAEGVMHVRERQTMVFDGAWNGGERRFSTRAGQRVNVEGVTRIDPVGGSSVPLAEGELDAVDEYRFSESVLRWRARLGIDPEFSNEQLTWEIAYTVAPILYPGDDRGEYMLAHDFLFADRSGPIEQFRIDLSADPVWDGQLARGIREEIAPVPQDRGYTVVTPVWFTGEGQPGAVPIGATTWVRQMVGIGALLAPLLLLLGLRSRQRKLDTTAPLTAPTQIDDAWLADHIFRYPPEIVGASWDRTVGASEVSALLARLVSENKLKSRVELEEDDPVLHLERIAPVDALESHERDLLNGLFFDGSAKTDTASIREHYKTEGFDPAGIIRKPIMAQLEDLEGGGRVARKWKMPLLLILLGALLATVGAGRSGGAMIGIVGLVAAFSVGVFAIASASILSKRVTARTGPTIAAIVFVTLGALPLFMLATGSFEGSEGLVFVLPGWEVLSGLLLTLLGIAWLVLELSVSSQTPERLVLRRRLVSARHFFKAELSRPEPQLRDAWFPYFLAFGLGKQIDEWWESFGGASMSSRTVIVPGTGGSSQGSGWTGGGVQFGGGGGFGGGGAGGSWGVAAAGLASGVSAPSSSGSGGGGGAVSGGGGGGGW